MPARADPAPEISRASRESESAAVTLISSHPVSFPGARNRPKGETRHAVTPLLTRLAAVSELRQDWFDELGELLRIPSVSADPAHQADVERAAEWVADKIRRGGGEAELDPVREASARRRRDPRVE